METAVHPGATARPPSMILGAGLHRGVPKDAYHADPCERPSLSASIATELVTRSPMHAWHAHPRGGAGRSEHTKATDNGTLIDSLLLGGDTEIVEVAADDFRTKVAKEARDAAREAGKLPVLAAELAVARAKANRIRESLRARGVVLDGENQLTAIWQERAIGYDDVWCRGRLDHWKPDIATIYDLKTTNSAAPRDVARKIVSYGYHIQAAAYVRAIETLNPELAGRVRFVWLFVECEEPFASLPVGPAGTMRELGTLRWRQAVNAWARGLASGKWPGYEVDELGIEAPAWALNEVPEGEGGSPDVTF